MYKKSFVLLTAYVMAFLFTHQHMYSQTIVASGEWGQHSYYIVSYYMQTWEVSKANTKILIGPDAYLATLTSQEEHDFVANLLEGVTGPDLYAEYWLGGYQQDPNAPLDETWAWITGENWNYINWADTEPNDYYGPFSEANLGIANWYDGWRWNDQGQLHDNLRGYVAEEGAIQVQIDIKPCSDLNIINCRNRNGVIPVAILSTDDFDATIVDHTTVIFEGASETHINKRTGLPRRHEKDVDHDGDTDLVFHFRRCETDLTCESEVGVLTGSTFDGYLIYGEDDVRMVKRKRHSFYASDIAKDYILSDNFPNPFNLETKIQFYIPKSSHVAVRIYNSLGEEVRILTDKQFETGYHSVIWNGKNNAGNTVPSGLYLIHFRSENYFQMKKMMLLK